MNPELEANVNEALNWLQKTGGAVQDFAVEQAPLYCREQAPLYCREVAAWEFWSGAVFGGIGIALTVIGFIALMKFVLFMKEDDGEPNARTLSSLGVALLGIIAGVPLVCQYAPKAIKAVVAPRMVIVEHLRNLPKP